MNESLEHDKVEDHNEMLETDSDVNILEPTIKLDDIFNETLHEKENDQNVSSSESPIIVQRDDITNIETSTGTNIGPDELLVGHDVSTGGEIGITLQSLLGNFLAIGGTGSGKTVLCKSIIEEAALKNIPSIIVDSNGDLASLGLMAEPDTSPIDINVAKLVKYAKNIRIVIFTPTSDKGIPISLNPLVIPKGDYDNEDLNKYAKNASASLLRLMGYNLDKEEGKLAQSLISLIFRGRLAQNKQINDLANLARIVDVLPQNIIDAEKVLIGDKEREKLARNIKLLSSNGNELVFNQGVPLDIDILLGKGFKDKTHVSIIYLDSLSGELEKDFFISNLVDSLHYWMMKNPAKTNEIQALFHIDEIATFFDKSDKSISKRPLQLLFNEAKDYGIGCLASTKYPQDIDYSSLPMFDCFGFGKLAENDINKMITGFETFGVYIPENITKMIPALIPPEFVIFNDDKISNFKIRPLYSKHTTLSTENIKNMVPLEIRCLYRKYTAQNSGITENGKLLKNRIADILKNSAKCYTINELISKTNLAEATIKKYLDASIKKGEIKKVKLYNDIYYYWKTHDLDPKKGIMESVLLPNSELNPFKIDEIIDKNLGKSLVLSKEFIQPNEKIIEKRSVLLPFWKFTIEFRADKGLFINKYYYAKKDIYVCAFDGKFATIKYGKLQFEKHLPHNFEKYTGFDSITEFNDKIPSDVIEENILPKIPSDHLQRELQTKFELKIIGSRLCYIPFSRIEIEHMKYKTRRTLWVDKITGNDFSFRYY